MFKRFRKRLKVYFIQLRFKDEVDTIHKYIYLWKKEVDRCKGNKELENQLFALSKLKKCFDYRINFIKKNSRSADGVLLLNLCIPGWNIYLEKSLEHQQKIRNANPNS